MVVQETGRAHYIRYLRFYFKQFPNFKCFSWKIIDDAKFVEEYI
jgi:hypothetical protein